MNELDFLAFALLWKAEKCSQESKIENAIDKLMILATLFSTEPSL